MKRCGRNSQSLNTIEHRSSHPEVFCKKGFLKNFAKFTEKHQCQGSFFNKVVGLRPATLLKKRLWHRCFPVNFVKFPNTPFFIVHLWWLLLKAIATLFSIGKASRNRVSYFSSLYLAKAKASIIVSSVIRKSAVNTTAIPDNTSTKRDNTSTKQHKIYFDRFISLLYTRSPLY